MRHIKFIAIHCSASPITTKVQSILNYWKQVLKWKTVGYHHLIEFDGTVHNLLPIEQVSNGVQGFNSRSINIAYIGGVDDSGKPKDTRSGSQKFALLELIQKYKAMFPDAVVQGHRDFPNVKKACPSFDVKTEYQNI